MKTSERSQALAVVSETGAWRTVRNWIRDMVSIEPRVMRQVAKETFGNLGNWIERGEDNIEACGCLVGTVALVMVEQRNHFKPNASLGFFEHTTNEFKSDGNEKGDSATTTAVVAALARKQLKEDMQDYASRAGGAAAMLGAHLSQDTAVALIKDEIVRALKRRKLAHA